MKILINLLHAEFVIMSILMLMLKKEVIVISLENIEALYIEIVISKLNEITKFLSYFTT